MGFIDRFLTSVFGETLPPASADGDDSTWDQHEHNKTLRKQLTASQAEVIRIADRQSRDRYNAMDAHIDKLKRMAEQSRRRKERLRALREAKAT